MIKDPSLRDENGNYRPLFYCPTCRENSRMDVDEVYPYPGNWNLPRTSISEREVEEFRLSYPSLQPGLMIIGTCLSCGEKQGMLASLSDFEWIDERTRIQTVVEVLTHATLLGYITGLEGNTVLDKTNGQVTLRRL